MRDVLTSETTRPSRAGRYLTLALGETEYALDILKVREIHGIIETTTVPRMPQSLRGVMNLRGRIIPVIELRNVFGMPQADDDSETRIIVVETEGMEVGIVVDRVEDTLELVEADIEDAPRLGTAVCSEFVRGIGKSGDLVTIVLDIDKVLSSAGFSAFEEATNSTSGLQG